MKKIIVLFLAASILFVSCAGLFNPEKKINGVEYKISPESVIWSIVGFETLIALIYLIGWELYEPYPADSPLQDCENVTPHPKHK